MKLFFLLIPMILFAASREECSRMVEAFAPLEQAYDAVVQAKVPAPASVEVIRRFREEGEHIYTVCKDRMSTTQWYMLGKKIKPYNVDIAAFELESPGDLTRYAISHPPVKTIVRCGTIRQGIHLPAR